MKKGPFARALGYAYRLLSIKGRTVKEMEKRLKEKGHKRECVEQVLEDLSNKKLLDDKRYAAEWIRASATIRPKGVWAIKSELGKKGLGEDLVNSILKDADVGYDEYSVAKALADKRAESLSDKEIIKRKKGVCDYLARRGFSFDIINDIVDDL